LAGLDVGDIKDTRVDVDGRLDEKIDAVVFETPELTDAVEDTIEDGLERKLISKRIYVKDRRAYCVDNVDADSLCELELLRTRVQADAGSPLRFRRLPLQVKK
jgi:hypothetical protein